MSSQFLWLRRMRWTLAILACSAMLFLVYGVIEMVRNSGDLNAVSGARLRMRLGEFWPSGVDGREISNAYVASDAAIDSGSMFLCFDAEKETVQKWLVFLRQQNQAEAQWLHSFHSRECETRESLTDSIPFHQATGEVPAWWLPSGNILGAFETMVWYTDSEAAAGRGKYIQYDESSKRCWIFTDAQQRKVLWARGEGQPVSGGEERQP